MQRDYLQRGSNPPARLSLMEEFYALIPYMTHDEIVEVMDGALEYGEIAPSMSIVGWGEINNVLTTAFDAVENGTDTPANTLPGFEDELIAKLKEIKETYDK
jgi:hypothetical protein